MKVLIATGLYPPEIGGPATYAKLLAEELPKKGIETVVLPFSTVRHLPRLVRHVAYFFKVFLRVHRTDIVFVQDTVSTGFPALLAAKLGGKPLILRVPGDYAWEQGRQRFGITDTCDDFQRKRYGFRVALLRAIQNLVARSADVVITPSKYFSDIVGGWGIPRERVRVVYNSVDVPEAVMPKSVPKGKILVSVGRLVPWKGFSTLIDIMEGLEGWHLVIIGDGPLRSELHRRTSEAGVAERVTFTGALSRAEVFGWYKTAQVFVLNTSFESFSYQVAEALAAGIPVVSTNIGSLPELVENGKEGILVRPNDADALRKAIKSVPEEKELWERRTSAGQRKAVQFSSSGIIEKLLEIFKGV